jgi:hypothetical protein
VGDAAAEAHPQRPIGQRLRFLTGMPVLVTDSRASFG